MIGCYQNVWSRDSVIDLTGAFTLKFTPIVIESREIKHWKTGEKKRNQELIEIFKAHSQQVKVVYNLSLDNMLLWR